MDQRAWVIIWSFVLLAAGSLAVAENTATAPYVAPELMFGGRDFLDSPHWLPAFPILAGLAAGAAWMVPKAGFTWGLVVCAPYFVIFTLAVIYSYRIGKNQGLWPVGLIFLLLVTMLPCLAAGVSAHLRGR